MLAVIAGDASTLREGVAMRGASRRACQNGTEGINHPHPYFSAMSSHVPVGRAVRVSYDAKVWIYRSDVAESERLVVPMIW